MGPVSQASSPLCRLGVWNDPVSGIDFFNVATMETVKRNVSPYAPVDTTNSLVYLRL